MNYNNICIHDMGKIFISNMYNARGIAIYFKTIINVKVELN